MSELGARVRESVAFIESRQKGRRPQVGIILGTGLGQLGAAIENPITIPYSEIPHFPVSTVESHEGSLISGTLEGHRVMAMRGRFHLYEGYDAAQVTFPVRVLKALGAETLFVSNACGGMNPAYEPGDLVVIDDHINLMGVNPLIGVNDSELGARFPDMSAPYDPGLQRLALEIAESAAVRCHRGVYVGVVGPCLETRAEYRFLRGIGADVVGMSTVPEVIVAVQCGLRVLCISIVTDRCIPETLKPTSIEEVIAVALRAEPDLTRVFRQVLARRAEVAAAPEASTIAHAAGRAQGSGAPGSGESSARG